MKVRYRGESDPLCLIHDKEYEVMSIEDGWYRIVDEMDDDYLYPSNAFEILDYKNVEKLLPDYCEIDKLIDQADEITVYRGDTLYLGVPGNMAFVYRLDHYDPYVWKIREMLSYAISSDFDLFLWERLDGEPEKAKELIREWREKKDGSIQSKKENNNQ